MIVQIRSFAKGIGTKILLAVLILTFAIWGVGDMVRSAGGNVEVASVGGIKISRQEYLGAVHREMDRLRQSLGKEFTPEVAKSFNIEQRVLQKMVDRNLLNLESKSLGLSVSDADVARRIRTNSAFFDDKGNFSKDNFTKFLRNTGQSEKEFADRVREDMQVQILVEAVSPILMPPENAAQVLFAARAEQRKIDLYNIPFSLVKDLPKPSDEQLKKYYDEHSSEFSVPEYRTISFVQFSSADAMKASSISDKEIEDEYNARIDEFKKTERRSVEQLIFGNEEAAKKAKAEIDSGKDFNRVAKESKIINADSISLGLIEKKGILDIAAEKVFSIAKGSVTEPVKSPFGWHIFYVKDIVPAVTLPLSEVRAQLVKELEKKSEDGALDKLSNKFDDLIAGGSTLSEAAKELNLKVITLAAIDINGKLENGMAEKSLPKDEKFLEAAFKTDEKTESSLLIGASGVRYILRVDKVSERHLKAFETVKEQLVAGWVAKEKSEKLAAISSVIAKEFSTLDGREKAIKEYGISAPSSMIISRKSVSEKKISTSMIMDVFDRKIGQATGSFPSENGEYAIAVVRDIMPASLDSKNDSEITMIKNQYSTDLQNEMNEEYMRSLAKKYPVSVNINAMQAVKSDE